MSKLALSLAGVLFCAAAAAAAEEGAAPAPGFSAGHPVLSRLNLSAEQAKKIDALAADYSKKAEALPEDASRATRQALAAERNAKIREALAAEQQPKYDAGMKTQAEHEAKVLKLQQETSAAMMSTPREELDKRREISKGYKEKRAALDAELARALDEQVGKRP